VAARTGAASCSFAVSDGLDCDINISSSLRCAFMVDVKVTKDKGNNPHIPKNGQVW
jgi:hypothetical protein